VKEAARKCAVASTVAAAASSSAGQLSAANSAGARRGPPRGGRAVRHRPAGNDTDGRAVHQRLQPRCVAIRHTGTDHGAPPQTLANTSASGCPEAETAAVCTSAIVPIKNAIMCRLGDPGTSAVLAHLTPASHLPPDVPLLHRVGRVTLPPSV
jgi:hypothetical protein